MEPPGFDPDINDPILPKGKSYGLMLSLKGFKCGETVLLSPNLPVSYFLIYFSSLFFVPALLKLESYLPSGLIGGSGLS